MSASRLRVLHAPVEVAGQAALSAYGLREIGVEARCFARPHRFDYPVAPDIDPGPDRLGWLTSAVGAVRQSDLVHFYFGASFLRSSMRALDARLLRRLGRQVIVEFMGSDVRMPSREAKRNPYYVRFDTEDDRGAHETMTRWSTVTGGHAITCDLALQVFLEDHFEHIHHVPFRVDTRRFAFHPPDPAVAVPVVLHSPSHLSGKGTHHLRAAVDELQRGGVELRYIELNGRGNGEIVDNLARADLVVDQLCVGSHGVFAAEAMSMGKPVVCYLEPEVAPLYPADLPIVNATPDNLTEVLAELLVKPAERHALGIASRRYAERVHDVRAVARLLLDVYSHLPS